MRCYRYTASRTEHWRKGKNPNAPGGAAGSGGRLETADARDQP
jgi:hypothetical protein